MTIHLKSDRVNAVKKCQPKRKTRMINGTKKQIKEELRTNLKKMFLVKRQPAFNSLKAFHDKMSIDNTLDNKNIVFNFC